MCACVCLGVGVGVHVAGFHACVSEQVCVYVLKLDMAAVFDSFVVGPRKII